VVWRLPSRARALVSCAHARGRPRGGPRRGASSLTVRGSRLSARPPDRPNRLSRRQSLVPLRRYESSIVCPPASPGVDPLVEPPAAEVPAASPEDPGLLIGVPLGCGLGFLFFAAIVAAKVFTKAKGARCPGGGGRWRRCTGPVPQGQCHRGSALLSLRPFRDVGGLRPRGLRPRGRCRAQRTPGQHARTLLRHVGAQGAAAASPGHPSSPGASQAPTAKRSTTTPAARSLTPTSRPSAPERS